VIPTLHRSVFLALFFTDLKAVQNRSSAMDVALKICLLLMVSIGLSKGMDV
jgi:hypothetical protein